MKYKMSSDKGKKPHLELLRLVAVYLVVLTHTGKRGYTYFTTLESSFSYFIAMLVPVICNIAVPLFYMISGATLIAKDEAPERILKRRLPRYLAIVFLASAMMYLYYGIMHKSEMTVGDFFRSVYSENIIVPYWFLYSYIGFLLLLPILRRTVRGLSDKEWHYLVVVYAVFKGLIPMLQYYLFRGDLTLNSSLNVVIMTNDLLIYPALGYYLEQRSVSPKKLGILWLCALVAIAVTVYMTHYKIVVTGEVDEGRVGAFYKSLCFLPAAAVYASIGRLTRMPKRIENVVCSLGECAFGVYLIEQILREQGYALCDKMTLFIPPIMAVLLYSALIVVACIGIIRLLKLVPGVSRLI